MSCHGNGIFLIGKKDSNWSLFISSVNERYVTKGKGPK